MSYLKKYSEEEYFRLLERSPYRIEYVDGFLFPMHDYGHAEPLTRLTSKHGLICGNLHALLYAPAKAAGLSLYASTMRVSTGGYTDPQGKIKRPSELPDLVTTLEDVLPTATHLRSPCLIAEVLSPRTRDLDRWYKLETYQRLPSLTHYLLVDTAFRSTRDGDDWREDYAEGEGEFLSPRVNMKLTLADLYDGTSL